MNQQNIETNMKTLANHFDFTQDELAKLLYKVNAFIAGSAPLNVFTQQELFDGLDLDIFLRIPYDKENEYPKNIKFKNHYYPYEELAKEQIIDSLETKGYFQVLQCGYNYQRENKETKDIEYMKCALTHFIKNIITFQKGNKKIQIITLYDCSIEDFMDTFDLNICRMVIMGNFGNELFLNKNHLSLEEIMEIKEKKMYIVNPLYPANLEKRIQKYLDRGFTWVHSTTKEELTRYTYNPGEISAYIYNAFDNSVITYEQFIENKKKKKESKTTFEYEDLMTETEEEKPVKKVVESDSEDEEPIKKTTKSKKLNIYHEEVLLSYKIELIEEGVKYMIKHNLIEACINYKFNNNDIDKIHCLDEFYLLEDTEENSDRNLNIKWDLEELIKSGSCYGLAVYIYELLKYIKDNKTIFVVEDKEPVKKVVESDSEDEEPVKKETKKLSFKSGYVYPIKYNSDHKQYTLDIINGYLKNIKKCPNKFFKIMNASDLFQFILSELEFIKSDEFCSVENSKYRFIITTYKKCIELKKTEYEPKSENEKLIYDEFLQIANKLFEELNKIQIPLNYIKELLNK